jgi:hypothetical protein
LLPREATFSKEVSLVQDPDCCFLPALGQNGQFYFSFLYVKDSIGRVALRKDRLFFGKSYDLSPAVDCRKEVWRLNLRRLLAASGVMVGLFQWSR